MGNNSGLLRFHTDKQGKTVKRFEKFNTGRLAPRKERRHSRWSAAGLWCSSPRSQAAAFLTNCCSEICKHLLLASIGGIFSKHCMRNATVEATVALSAWPQPHMERQFNSRSITYEQIFFLVSGILKRCSLWKSLFVNAECGFVDYMVWISLLECNLTEL